MELETCMHGPKGKNVSMAKLELGHLVLLYPQPVTPLLDPEEYPYSVLNITLASSLIKAYCRVKKSYIDSLKAHIKVAAENKDPKKLFATYLPGNCLQDIDVAVIFTPIKNSKQWGSPKHVAKQVNPPLELFIRELGDQKTGIVVFDYPYKSLIQEVLNKNQGIMRT